MKGTTYKDPCYSVSSDNLLVHFSQVAFFLNTPKCSTARRWKVNVKYQNAFLRKHVTDWIKLAQESMNTNVSFDSLKGGEYIDKVSDYQLLKKSSDSR
jgi:hypothetical protein